MNSLLKEEYFIEGLQISGQPIPFYNERVYNPTIKEIFRMGEIRFFKYVNPFIQSLDMYPELKTNEHVKAFKLNIFDFMMNDEINRNGLIEALKFFLHLSDNDIIYQVSDIGKGYFYIDKDIKTKIETGDYIADGNCVFNSEILAELQEIITKITNTRTLTYKDIKDDSIKVDEEKANSIINPAFAGYVGSISKSLDKLKKGRTERAKKEKIDKISKLYNIFRFVVYDSKFDYETVLNWNIYQLYDCYNALHEMDNYDYTMRIATSGMADTKKMDLSPLSKRLLK